MKSAFECFQNAAKCEAMALIARDHLDRTHLLNAAAHWKALGNRAKRTEEAKTFELPALKSTGG